MMWCSLHDIDETKMRFFLDVLENTVFLLEQLEDFIFVCLHHSIYADHFQNANIEHNYTKCKHDFLYNQIIAMYETGFGCTLHKNRYLISPRDKLREKKHP